MSQSLNSLHYRAYGAYRLNSIKALDLLRQSETSIMQQNQIP